MNPRAGVFVFTLTAAATPSVGCQATNSEAFRRASLADDRNWLAVVDVPTLHQDGPADCGDMVTAMLLQHWGHPGEPWAIRAASGQPEGEGLRAGFVRDYLRAQGMQAWLLAGTPEDLARELRAGRPVIVGIARPDRRATLAHYLLAVGINVQKPELLVIDPGEGWRRYAIEDFMAVWSPTQDLMIVASPMP